MHCDHQHADRTSHNGEDNWWFYHLCMERRSVLYGIMLKITDPKSEKLKPCETRQLQEVNCYNLLPPGKLRFSVGIVFSCVCIFIVVVVVGFFCVRNTTVFYKKYSRYPNQTFSHNLLASWADQVSLSLAVSLSVSLPLSLSLTYYSIILLH